MCKVKEDLPEIYKYQIDPVYVNDSLTNTKYKLTELEDRSRRNNMPIDGIADVSGETWEECERKVQRSFIEKLDLKSVVIERAQGVKAYSNEKNNNKKLRPGTVVCNLPSFVNKARILRKNYRLKRTSYYVNNDFSKETLAYRKYL